MSAPEPPRPIPSRSGLLRSALGLAGRGWHVFPCAAGAKRPALRGNWQDLATTDDELIVYWWGRMSYNIGISCGPSGLVVIDLDVRKDDYSPAGHRAFGDRRAFGQGRPASGAESLAGLCQASGQPYPAGTFTVSTPSGGAHLYFTAPPSGPPVMNSAGRLGPLIDIRADGGYVLGPGSHVGDRGYAVLDDSPPAPLPEWIAAALAPRASRDARPLPAPGSRAGTAYAMAALRDECRQLAAAADGTRHDTLNRAAFSLGQLVGAGLLPDLAVITSLADAARIAGLPERESLRIIRSSMAAGIRKPRRLL